MDDFVREVYYRTHNEFCVFVLSYCGSQRLRCECKNSSYHCRSNGGAVNITCHRERERAATVRVLFSWIRRIGKCEMKWSSFAERYCLLFGNSEFAIRFDSIRSRSEQESIRIHTHARTHSCAANIRCVIDGGSVRARIFSFLFFYHIYFCFSLPPFTWSWTPHYSRSFFYPSSISWWCCHCFWLLVKMNNDWIEYITSNLILSEKEDEKITKLIEWVRRQTLNDGKHINK